MVTFHVQQKRIVMTGEKAPHLPNRAPWQGEEVVFIHDLDEMAVRNDPYYVAAKRGDVEAAVQLVTTHANEDVANALRAEVGERTPILLPVHAEEAAGRNPIPFALAKWLNVRTGWEVSSTKIVQANVVGRTKTDGYYRLAMQPIFDGDAQEGRCYVLVDDFIGQGGTFANLRGQVLATGGEVLSHTSLTGKPLSANLGLRLATLEELRGTHGNDLEEWWREAFGYGFGELTESEARYLINRTDSVRVRAEIVERFRRYNG
jgi:hypothetical protein